MDKRIYPYNKDLFNVTFRVDCVLKGSPTEQMISITDAGQLRDRTSCQSLQAGKQYIVFLEKYFEIYRPTDYQELEYDNMTIDLLQKTCGLIQLDPVHHFPNKNCPNVSVNSYCPVDMINKDRVPFTNEHTQSPFNAPHNNILDQQGFALQENVTIGQIYEGSKQISDDINRLNMGALSVTRQNFLIYGVLALVCFLYVL
ncbi:unnamed protein product [Didymodactylos carnosus]|uniref:Uncharacterized protein n=1 Tax=Didymodactylos carnosus TaxID=1234261 RepID=A0A813WA08_9BILA|nr:unnamed protein product [Didymodactylos carnosus]CAF0884709.1 unnamed protein product [Didymodactylos carnosus]CAF3639639.1 unnamed protein product [Didymodactylos carnosus]CAF3667801.1 unnamed protein product [Didymodactylos carnosus]